MTDYDHDKAKVLYPAGAAEVERLRVEVDRLRRSTPEYAAQQAMKRAYDEMQRAKESGKIKP